MPTSPKTRWGPPLYINTRKIQVIALAFFALLPPDTFQPSACESPRGNSTVFDILHTLGTSCQALHRAIAHTLARLRVRDFLTHLMSLRYIVAGTAVVRAPSDTRPPRPPTTSALPPATC